MDKAKVFIAIVQRGPLFAFLHRADGSPTFPSGKVEAGESLDDAVHREVEEETGLKVSSLTYMGSRENDTENLHYFLCPYAGGLLHVRKPEKFQSAEWLTGTQILEMTQGRMFGPVAQYLKKSSSSQPGPGFH